MTTEQLCFMVKKHKKNQRTASNDCNAYLFDFTMLKAECGMEYALYINN